MKLLPKLKPGHCFFLTFMNIMKDLNVHADIYKLFFLSGGFSFTYEGKSGDIQKNYVNYGNDNLIYHLSKNYKFTYKIIRVSDNREYRSSELSDCVKHNKVIIDIHISGLSYGKSLENQLRENTYHCIQPYKITGNRIYFHDFYVPEINKGYKCVSDSLPYPDALQYIKDYTVIYPPFRELNENEFLVVMHRNLVDFFIRNTNTSFGYQAIVSFIKNINFQQLSSGSLLAKNMLGLLFIIKYQLYTGYYYLIQAVAMHFEKTDKEMIIRTNNLWETVFVQLEMLILKPVVSNFLRLQKSMFELLHDIKIIVNDFVEHIRN